MDGENVSKFSLHFEVDHDYDDPDRLASELQQAIDNTEDVTLSVAGSVFHVNLVSYRGPLAP